MIKESIKAAITFEDEMKQVNKMWREFEESDVNIKRRELASRIAKHYPCSVMDAWHDILLGECYGNTLDELETLYF